MAYSLSLSSSAYYSNIAVEPVEFDLRATIAHSKTRKTISSINKHSVDSLSLRRRRRQIFHVKVGIQTAIECLHLQIGGEIRLKRNFDRPVDGLESRRRFRILQKRYIHRSVHSLSASGTANVRHRDPAIDVFNLKIAS